MIETKEKPVFYCGEAELTWGKVICAANLLEGVREIYISLKPKTFDVLMQNRGSLIIHPNTITIEGCIGFIPTAHGFLRIYIKLNRENTLVTNVGEIILRGIVERD